MPSMATPPERQLEVVISIDTTSSMPSWLSSLQANFKTMIQLLQRDIPGIRIGVIAHGDYGDVDKYVTKSMDLTSNVQNLRGFVSKIQGTVGDDAPECYELVLRRVADDFSWTPGCCRVLTMIGDDVPHEPNEKCNKDNIDWRQETEKLKNLGVKIYGIQCKGYPIAVDFYKTISKMTGGKHLQLNNAGSLCGTLTAVCLKESGDTANFASFQSEITNRSSGPGRDLRGVFVALKDADNHDITGNGLHMDKIDTISVDFNEKKAETDKSDRITKKEDFINDKETQTQSSNGIHS